MRVHAELDFSVDDIPDMHRVLAELRAESPVIEVRHLGEPAWAIVGYELLRDALRDEETFPSAAAYSKHTDPAVGRTLNSMQGAEHHRNRAIVSPVFRKQKTASYRESMLAPICHQLIDAFEGRREVELWSEYTHLFPMIVIMQLLGLPWHEYETLERWANALFTFPTDPDGALRAKRELTEYLSRVVEQRRADPTDDLVSTLVTGEFHGRTLSDEEIFSFLRLLFPAGTHNTTNGMSSLLFAVISDPERFERVRDDLDARDWAVEETLRWEPPVGNLPRRASAAGGEWGGVEIPPDAAMIYSFAAAGRDPAMYPHPDRFDLDRHAEETLTFGLGEHFCSGAALARDEMRVVLDVLLERVREVRLVDPAAARPRGAMLRGPRELRVEIGW